MAFLEHLIGLPYPCAVTEVYLQPATLGTTDHPEKSVSPVFIHNVSDILHNDSAAGFTGEPWNYVMLWVMGAR